MFSNRDMRDADNENEPLPFQTLAAATARVLSQTKNQNDEGADDREPEQRSERRKEPNNEYVEQRLRELSAFERRARGHQKPL
jgi:hypothetical protein